MDTEDAEIARDLMDGERTGRGLGIDEKFATIGVDQFARDPGRPCGCPLESRITISICRPASPPAALIFSTSIVTALRDEVPSCATRPERIVGMPTLMVLACACATHGVANVTAPAPISASVDRRLRPGLLFLVMLPPSTSVRP